MDEGKGAMICRIAYVVLGVMALAVISGVIFWMADLELHDDEPF